MISLAHRLRGAESQSAELDEARPSTAGTDLLIGNESMTGHDW
jgi:hypothetical protein